MPLSYQETLDFLYQQLPMFQRQGPTAYKKDLGNTYALMEVLGEPYKKFPAIHIAGTNGKGSVTHIIASILQETGLKVGYYTSPHYKDFRERIKINGEPVSQEFITSFVEGLRPDIDRIQPSFFEITVAMAFEYFAEQQVDIAVIETGLGGRLDSTNVLKPILSVITNIGYDHQNLLGDTLPEIAGEKAGIIKPNTPALVGQRQTEVESVFLEKAKKVGTSITYSDEIVQIGDWNQSNARSRFLWSEDSYESDLWGNYQLQNIQTSLAALLIIKDHFSINTNQLRNGLLKVRSNTGFLGRCQILGREPLIIVDGAHNINGLEALLENLRDLDFEKLHVVFGTVSDKDPQKSIALLPKKATYYLARPDIPRGMNALELQMAFDANGLSSDAYDSVSEALQSARRASSSKDLVLVCGSIFVVAEAL